MRPTMSVAPPGGCGIRHWATQASAAYSCLRLRLLIQPPTTAAASSKPCSMQGSPRVAQFAELQEHRALVGLLRQFGKGLAQFRDHHWAGQAKERVDLRFDFERGYVRAIGVLTGELVEHLPGALVVGLAIQCETQIVFHVIVARINQCRLRQLGELLVKCLVELFRMTAVVAIPGAGVE